MPTQTRPRRSSSQPQGRFNRSTTAGRRSTVPGRRSPAAGRRLPSVPRRRQPQQSGLKKLVGGLVPAAAGKKAANKTAGNRGKVGGLGALLAAGAGLAYKNRSKLAGLRGRKQDSSQATDAPTVPPVTTTTDTATTDTHGH